MIVIDPLDQDPAVFHQKIIGQPMEEKQQEIRAGGRIAVAGLKLLRILAQITGSGFRAVNAHGVPGSPVIGAPGVVLIA